MAAAQCVHQHVRGRQMRGGLWVPRLPALEACKNVRFLASAPDLDERTARRPTT
jgi:hypothetical protein